MNQIKNIPLLVSWSALAVMLLLSILFYKERTIFIDTSFYVFELVRTKSFLVSHFRFGSFFSQLLPLLALKAGAGLATISLLYSASIAIYYIVVFYILWFKLKEWKLAIAMLLGYLLICSYSFYWIASELHMGVAFVFLLFGYFKNYLNSGKLNPRHLLIFPLGIFIAAFFHPLIIFPFTFLFLYFYINENTFRRDYLYFGIGFICFYFIRTLFIKTPYDENSKSGLIIGLNSLGNFFQFVSTKKSFTYFVNDYYRYLVFILGLCAYFIYQRKFTSLLLMLGFTVILYVTINMNYMQGGEQFYLENQYCILGFFASTAFVYECWDKIKPYQFNTVLIVVFALAFMKIFTFHSVMDQRLDWFRNFLSKTENLPNKKIIITKEKLPLDTLNMSWCIPYEVWQLSTIERSESRSVLGEESSGEFDWITKTKDTFFPKWGSYKYNELDKKYFIFNDTTYYSKY